MHNEGRSTRSSSSGHAKDLHQYLRGTQENKGGPPQMTYEEFLDWTDEDMLAEWVDGKVILTSPASRKHQRLLSFLDRFVGLFVESRELGEVLVSPFQMKLPNSGREPDVLFVAQKHLHRLQDTFLEGPADLVVEIISPESSARDRGDKYYEYEAGGVPEYWLLDPLTERAEFYQLDANGHYQLVRPQDGVYRSAVVPGFWLREEWLWQEPLPSPLRVLAEITGIDPSLV